ncbi:TonB-dependent receptor [Pseudorhodoferax sp. Leaf274]|nr:TonB-dependent receptor [Pseudorhodoferax sp. Leaf274]
MSTVMLMPLGALAQTTSSGGTLNEVKVQATRIDPNPNAEVGVPYKAKSSGDARHTRPLAETPQTISVITADAIKDSGQTDLAQILLATPGVTLGVGENGNMFGDNYFIRGQAAKSDIFVDGLRDPGMNTRESFAIEQVEITKGPNSSFAGRGSSGGAVNAVTKQATLDYDFNRASIGFGTDKFQRHTVDLNRAVNDNLAVRINALWADQDVPDRSPSSRERKGLAVSGLLEVSKDLSVTLDYYGLRASNPYYDAGGWLTGTAGNRVPGTVMPPHAQDADFMKSDSDTATARVQWKISPVLSLDSRTRFGRTKNAYAFSTGNYSTTAHDGSNAGTNPATTGAAVIDEVHSRWQDVKYFAHQDSLRWDTDLGNGRKNEFVATFEYSDHRVDQGAYIATNSNAANCKTTAGVGANNAYCMTTFGPDGTITPLANIQSLKGVSWAKNGQNYDWNIKTVALSAMDTMDFTDRFTGFAGVRLDRILKFNAQTMNATTGAVTGDYEYKKTLANFWGGLSYKLTPQGMVYLGYGTGQDINGGEPDSGTNPGYGGLVTSTLDGNLNSKPETTRNFELGTKWNLLNQKLLATAAVFRTEKSDVMEGVSQAEGAQIGTLNTGGYRVQGVEFGLVGNVTDNLTVQAGAAFMKSKITKSNASLSNGTGRLNIGQRLGNFADQTFNVQAKYQFTQAFSFGAIARHESYRCGGQPDTAAAYSTTGTGAAATVAVSCTQRVPGFTVYDLFASYRINKNFMVRGTVLNVADKDYYTGAYRSGKWLTIGDKRRVMASLEMDF